MNLPQSETAVVSRPVVVPFNEIDEACLAASPPGSPFNIEVEAAWPCRIDVRRLREAVARAIPWHPMAGARQARSSLLATRHRWEVGAGRDADPVIVRVARNDEAADEARSELSSAPIPVDRAPPFRLMVLRTSDGDVLSLAQSHVASDGIGALRLLRSISSAYFAGAELNPPWDPIEGRDLSPHFAAPGSMDWFRRMRLAQKVQSEAWSSRPAHVEPLGARQLPGFGVHHLRLSVASSARLYERRPGSPTVNDRLLAALTMAIDEWNGKRGNRPDRIALVMPISLRGSARRADVMANLSVATVVSTSASERVTAAGLVEAIRLTTARIKTDVPAAGLIELYRIASRGPAILKHGVSRWLAATTAPRVMPTAILSNLGVIEDPFGSGPRGRPSAVWFSPPCRMPTGLGVGVLTYRQTLFVSFRYCHALFSREAARDFGSVFQAAVEQLATGQKAPKKTRRPPRGDRPAPEAKRPSIRGT